jgi:antitoxin ParD1/3/4
LAVLSISLPDAMRDYVEQQAAQGSYSASEYVRHLIRQDQHRQRDEERALLKEFLALSAQQIDEGDLADVTVEGLLAKGRAKRRGQASE